MKVEERQLFVDMTVKLVGIDVVTAVQCSLHNMATGKYRVSMDREVSCFSASIFDC